jgi:hypothetical protein
MKTSTFTLLVILLTILGFIYSHHLLTDDARPLSLNKSAYTYTGHIGDSVVVLQSAPVKPEQRIVIKPKKISTVLLDSKQLVFNENPVFLVWISIFCIMVAVSFGLVLPLLQRIASLTSFFETKSRRPLIFVFVMGISLIGLLSFYSNGRDNVLDPAEIMKKFGVLLLNTGNLSILVKTVTSIGVLSVVGMLVVNLCIPILEEKSGDELIVSVKQLFSALRFFLTACAVLVVFSVATTSLLQQSIVGRIEVLKFSKGFKIFPDQFIYLYSLLFSFFLVAIYLPIEYHLRSVSEQKLNTLKDDEKTKASGQKIIDEQKTTSKTFQLIISLLSPILGNLFVDVVKDLL